MNLDPEEFLAILRDFLNRNLIHQAFLDETTFILKHLQELLTPTQIQTEGFALLNAFALEEFQTARLQLETLNIPPSRIDAFITELQEYQATLKAIVNSTL
jgi:hypothetical protein